MNCQRGGGVALDHRDGGDYDHGMMIFQVSEIKASKPPTVIVVALLVFITCRVGWTKSQNNNASQDADWALRITEREYDPKTGVLRLMLENTSDYLVVTAFGVVASAARPDAGGRSKSWEKLPGPGLAPGEVQEATFDFSRKEQEGRTGAPLDTIAELLFEIRSDLTSRGDSAWVESHFLSRSVQLNEVEFMLARLQQIRSGESDLFEELLSDFRIRAKTPSSGSAPSELELTRRRTISSLTDLVEQAAAKVENGKLAENASDDLKWVVREHYLEPLSAGVRSQDLIAGD